MRTYLALATVPLAVFATGWQLVCASACAEIDHAQAERVHHEHAAPHPGEHHHEPIPEAVEHDQPDASTPTDHANLRCGADIAFNVNRRHAPSVAVSIQRLDEQLRTHIGHAAVNASSERAPPTISTLVSQHVLQLC